jgi:hypothetical protein
MLVLKETLKELLAALPVQVVNALRPLAEKLAKDGPVTATFGLCSLAARVARCWSCEDIAVAEQLAAEHGEEACNSALCLLLADLGVLQTDDGVLSYPVSEPIGCGGDHA